MVGVAVEQGVGEGAGAAGGGAGGLEEDFRGGSGRSGGGADGSGPGGQTERAAEEREPPKEAATGEATAERMLAIHRKVITEENLPSSRMIRSLGG